MVEALSQRLTNVFARGIVSLKDIWEAGDPTAMYSTRTPPIEARLSEGLVIELYAVGAIAAHLGLWEQVRELASQVSQNSGEGWLRQGQVASGRSKTDSVEFARLIIRRVSDLAGDSIRDAAPTAFAAVDLFSALVITELGITHGYFPNAAVFDAGHRRTASDQRAAPQGQPRQNVRIRWRRRAAARHTSRVRPAGAVPGRVHALLRPGLEVARLRRRTHLGLHRTGRRH